MIDLDDPAKYVAPEPEEEAPRALDLGDLVAAPGFAPREWQTGAPRDVFAGHKPPVGDSEDLQRILALPRRPTPSEDQCEAYVELMTRRLSRGVPKGRCRCAEVVAAYGGKPRACIERLLPIQARMLFEMGIAGGLIGAVAVGAGKTLAGILAPLVIPDCRKALLLVPPTLVTQLVNDYNLVAEHFRVPSLVVHGKVNGREHPGYRVPGAPVLHVLPYSVLSRPESTAFVNQLAPDAIIADECDRLRNPDGAGSSRILRYFRDHPGCRFFAWSGSVTEASPKDYAHHGAMALREKSPLPLVPEVVDDWARGLDPKTRWPAPPGALEQLCEPGEHVYHGFRRRLHDTLGVVASVSAPVEIALTIDERVAPEIPAEVEAALATLRAEWVRPDGEQLIEAAAVAKCARELACGFYYYWFFPPIHGQPQSRDHVDDWLDARKEWHKELREVLKDRTEHMDSEMLCTRAAMRAWGDDPADADVEGDEEAQAIALAYAQRVEAAHGAPVWRAKAWPRWRDIRRTVVHETRTHRLSDYLVRDAAAWALENRGIVWYASRAIGEWIAELSGLEMHGGGPGAGERIARVSGERSIIASTKSHGRGRDGLQFLYSDQLVVEPPTSATIWEQKLGRLVRRGQRAEMVRTWFYRHTPEMKKAVAAALRRAEYVEGTIGAPQKLRLGFPVDDPDLE